MNRTIRERIWCRLCNGRMASRFALADTPIANDYAEKPDADAKRYPLELSECSVCLHVQQRFVIDGLFDDYKYVTPATVASYLTPVAKMLRAEYPNAKRVLEIGSNSGVFLDCLTAEGFTAVGIDPANTHASGIKAYFGSREAHNFHVKFDLIVANNVLAHIDDLKDVFKGIEMLLAPDGALIFEVQYFNALVDSGSFDMIYHEHMSYHTIAPLARFLIRNGLVMTRSEFIPQHGGSIRITAKRNSEGWVLEERSINWSQFGSTVHGMRELVREKVAGRKLVLLGAAAKVTTLIHHCDIADSIMYACDDTPQKQGRYIPGTNIQIMPMTALRGEPALLGAWNYESEFRKMFPNNELIAPFSEETVCA